MPTVNARAVQAAIKPSTKKETPIMAKKLKKVYVTDIVWDISN